MRTAPIQENRECFLHSAGNFNTDFSQDCLEFAIIIFPFEFNMDLTEDVQRCGRQVFAMGLMVNCPCACSYSCNVLVLGILSVCRHGFSLILQKKKKNLYMVVYQTGKHQLNNLLPKKEKEKRLEFTQKRFKEKISTLCTGSSKRRKSFHCNLNEKG